MMKNILLKRIKRNEEIDETWNLYFLEKFESLLDRVIFDRDQLDSRIIFELISTIWIYDCFVLNAIVNQFFPVGIGSQCLHISNNDQ